MITLTLTLNRTSIESAATVETVDTIDTVSVDSDSNISPRRSSRKKKLLKPNFKGMTGSGSDEHYKVGRHGGVYRGKGAKKRAPKSAV